MATLGRFSKCMKTSQAEDDTTSCLASLWHEERARLTGNGLTRINGVLCLTHTPEPLLRGAQENATRLPLLHLPAELRNLIWEFSLSYESLELERLYCSECLPEPYRIRCYANPHKGDPNPHSALHISETSRQIYAETSTLALKNNVVRAHSRKVFELNSHIPALHHGIVALMTTEGLYTYYRMYIRKIKNRGEPKRPCLTSLFPNVNHTQIERNRACPICDCTRHQTSWEDFEREVRRQEKKPDLKISRTNVPKPS